MKTEPLKTEPGVDDQAAALSSLMDGDADAADVLKASARWRDDPAARSTWHAYHLVGDVLRSDDLASPPGHDAAFLAALRVRLAAEPALLAPSPVPVASVRRRSAWLVPMAVAAGFVAVAGVLLVTRLSAPDPAAAPVLASRSVPPDGARRVAIDPPIAGPLLVLSGAPGDARFIRDAQLDAYLRAHRDMRGGSAAALPGAELRGLATVSAQR